MRPRWSRLLVAAALLGACAGDDSTTQGTDLGQQTAERADESSTSEPDADRPTAAVDLPDGWTLAEADGWAVGLPDGWFNAHRALADEGFMDELVAASGDFVGKDLRAFVEEAIAGLDLLAVNAEELTDEFATTINVLRMPRGPMDEPEVILATADDLVASFGGVVTGTDMYDVAGLPAVEITYEVAMDTVEFIGIQSHVFAADAIFVVTYSAIEPDVEVWQSVLDTFALTG